jgi:hypothetical protein
VRARCIDRPPGHGRLALILAGVSIVLAGCSPSGQSPTSAVESQTAAASGAGAVGLPEGCQPITLLDPAGTPIQLDGFWLEDAPTDGASHMEWWIRVLGDCVWGSGSVSAIEIPPMQLGDVQVLRGRLGNDYVIDGEIVLLGVSDSFRSDPVYAPVRMLIEFDDDNGVVLREDREPGETGPRCVDPVQACIRPLVLRPATEIPN